MKPYLCIWEFKVRPGREAEFEARYGADGSWVRLFRSAPGYLDTLLLRDREERGRYLTLDRWESEEAHRDFRRARAAEVDALDRECEALTLSEREMGRFDGICTKGD